MFHASDYSADRKISFDEYMVCMGRSPPGDYRCVDRAAIPSATTYLAVVCTPHCRHAGDKMYSCKSRSMIEENIVLAIQNKIQCTRTENIEF